MAISAGVSEIIARRRTDDMVRQVETALLSVGRCQKGDTVVIVAGSPARNTSPD